MFYRTSVCVIVLCTQTQKKNTPTYTRVNTRRRDAMLFLCFSCCTCSDSGQNWNKILLQVFVFLFYYSLVFVCHLWGENWNNSWDWKLLIVHLHVYTFYPDFESNLLFCKWKQPFICKKSTVLSLQLTKNEEHDLFLIYF